MFLKAVKRDHLNSQTSNTITELMVNLVDSLSLNFLDSVPKCLYTYIHLNTVFEQLYPCL